MQAASESVPKPQSSARECDALSCGSLWISQRDKLAVATAVGDDDRLAPFFHGCEGDAARAARSVDAPGEVALAIPLKFSGAAKGHAIGSVWRDCVTNGHWAGGRIGGYWSGSRGCFHGCWRPIGGAVGYGLAVYGSGCITAGRRGADFGHRMTVEVGGAIGAVFRAGRVVRENVAAA